MKVDISWIRPEQIVEFELIQLHDEGADTLQLIKEWDALKSQFEDIDLLRKEAEKFLDKLESRKGELNNNAIQSFIDELKQNQSEDAAGLSSEVLHDKILGGWNGRAAGCLLGKPIEKYSREVIKEILSSNNTYPLDNYITAEGIPEELITKYPWNRHDGRESLRENIVCMNEDDDLNYTMLNLHILEQFGKEFTTKNVAETWLAYMPVMSVFTAERAVYNNLLRLIDLAKVPVYRNPYREWIGAMIRADVWGWAFPGDPVQAVQLAFNDAALSHTGEGVLAEMYIAALTAISFKMDNPKEVLLKALEFIPSKSEIAKAVKFGIAAAEEYSSLDKILDELHKEYKNYFWVHSVNNMALIAAALVYGNGDFEKSICATVMGGLDTDSSGATVGAVIGTLNGFKNLPSKWIAPLNNKIRSSIKGFDNSALTNLAERTYNIATNTELK